MKRNYWKIGGVVLAAVVVAGSAITGYAACNPDSALGQLVFAASATPEEGVGNFVLEEDGSARPMTQEEWDAFSQLPQDAITGVAGDGGISPDGENWYAAGWDSQTPLVIGEDGSVRPMTQEEQDSLGTGEEFTAEAGQIPVEGSFGQ